MSRLVESLEEDLRELVRKYDPALVVQMRAKAAAHLIEAEASILGGALLGRNRKVALASLDSILEQCQTIAEYVRTLKE